MVNLRNELAASLSDSPETLTAILQRYADRGGTKEGAYQVLESLRVHAQDEKTEEQVLDLMDVVSGFCPLHRRIWR